MAARGVRVAVSGPSRRGPRPALVSRRVGRARIRACGDLGPNRRIAESPDRWSTGPGRRAWPKSDAPRPSRSRRHTRCAAPRCRVRPGRPSIRDHSGTATGGVRAASGRLRAVLGGRVPDVLAAARAGEAKAASCGCAVPPAGPATVRRRYRRRASAADVALAVHVSGACIRCPLVGRVTRRGRREPPLPARDGRSGHPSPRRAGAAVPGPDSAGDSSSTARHRAVESGRPFNRSRMSWTSPSTSSAVIHGSGSSRRHDAVSCTGRSHPPRSRSRPTRTPPAR